MCMTPGVANPHLSATHTQILLRCWEAMRSHVTVACPLCAGRDASNAPLVQVSVWDGVGTRWGAWECVSRVGL